MAPPPKKKCLQKWVFQLCPKNATKHCKYQSFCKSARLFLGGTKNINILLKTKTTKTSHPKNQPGSFGFFLRLFWETPPQGPQRDGPSEPRLGGLRQAGEGRCLWCQSGDWRTSRVWVVGVVSRFFFVFFSEFLFGVFAF